jgi:hypothetical protein
MKWLGFLVIPVSIVIIYLFFSGNSHKEYIDNEYITDDGFHLRFDGVSCEADQVANVLVGLSPVRDNQYNACLSVDLKVSLLQDSNRVAEFTYLWGVSNCKPDEAREETLHLSLVEHLGNNIASNICADPSSYSFSLQDYRYIKAPESISNSRSADPLGQQPRLISSIPNKRQSSSAGSVRIRQVDKSQIIHLQKKLSLLSSYEGPYDGIWNDEMSQVIKKIQIENYIFFESVDSDSTFEILGLKYDKYENI